MKTFKAIDGRRCRMNEDQVKEAMFVTIAAVLSPILTILVFAVSAGML